MRFLLNRLLQRMFQRTLGVVVILGLLFITASSAYALNEPTISSLASNQVPITILHTNDLHSHFRGTNESPKLGGVARIATKIREVKSLNQNVIVLDGGDWSEGQIYYNLGAGRTAIEIMEALNYDATVVGNHDFLNGPDLVLENLKTIPHKTSYLAANVDLDSYKNKTLWQKHVFPHQILNRGGLKIGVFGLVTYELMYDKYLTPIKIIDPITVAKKTSNFLRNNENCDLVIAISHNSLGMNKLVGALPNIDVVIHAHDHKKLVDPVIVNKKNGKKTFIVEAHKWGRFLGKLDLFVNTVDKSFALSGYKLIPIDRSITPDPVVESLVDRYDIELQKKYPKVFDPIVTAEIDLKKEGAQSLFGDFVTDAYRDFARADVAFEHMSITSGEIYRGALSNADFYNALSAIYNPKTDKTWALSTAEATGETLRWVMNFVFNLGTVYPSGLVQVSGLSAVYDPKGPVENPETVSLMSVLFPDFLNTYYPSLFRSELSFTFNKQDDLVREILVGGVPLDLKKNYTIALPQSMIEVVEFVKSYLGKTIDFKNIQSTDVEQWKVVRDYALSKSAIRSSVVNRLGRIEVVQEDLAVFSDELLVEPIGGTNRSKVRVTVRNVGHTASTLRELYLRADATPMDAGDDPNFGVILAKFTVPSLQPQDALVFESEVDWKPLSKETAAVLYASFNESRADPNPTNDLTWYSP